MIFKRNYDSRIKIENFSKILENVIYSRIKPENHLKILTFPSSSRLSLFLSYPNSSSTSQLFLPFLSKSSLAITSPKRPSLLHLTPAVLSAKIPAGDDPSNAAYTRPSRSNRELLFSSKFLLSLLLLFRPSSVHAN